ncbi:MAG: hypothetical protein AAGF67_01205 [Verrucomicrobiota bacterium]
MRFPSYPVILTLCLLAFSMVPSKAQFDPASSSLPEGAIKAVQAKCDEYASKVMPAVLTMDDNEDGKVGLKDLVTGLMSRGYAKADKEVSHIEDPIERSTFERMQSSAAEADRGFAAALQTDDEGNVREQDLSFAMQVLILSALERIGQLDVNGDKKLELSEYALSRPIREGEEVDAEGYSEHQREDFAEMDTDGNELIEDAEFVGSMWGMIDAAVDRFIASVLIGAADADGDGTLSVEEIQTVLPGAENLPDAIPMERSVFWLRMLPGEELATLVGNLEKAGDS